MDPRPPRGKPVGPEHDRERIRCTLKNRGAHVVTLSAENKSAILWRLKNHPDVRSARDEDLVWWEGTGWHAVIWFVSSGLSESSQGVAVMFKDGSTQYGDLVAQDGRLGIRTQDDKGTIYDLGPLAD